LPAVETYSRYEQSLRESRSLPVPPERQSQKQSICARDPYSLPEQRTKLDAVTGGKEGNNDMGHLIIGFLVDIGFAMLAACVVELVKRWWLRR
jgi:hypothetical protein